ncbi:hypothetical protein MRX96_058877 [Rhipicephalus microplus]
MSSAGSSESDPVPTEVSFRMLTDDEEAQSFEDTPDVEAQVVELQRQLASSLVIQEWARSRFQPWLQQRGRRSRSGSLQAASESMSDEDFGVVLPTIAESAEMDTTGVRHPVRGYSEERLSVGSLTTNASRDTIEDQIEERHSSVGAATDQSYNSHVATPSRLSVGEFAVLNVSVCCWY